jgi:hypothetical protein
MPDAVTGKPHAWRLTPVCGVTDCIRADEVLAGVAGVVGLLPPGAHVAIHEQEIQLLLWQQRAGEAETGKRRPSMDCGTDPAFG